MKPITDIVLGFWDGPLRRSTLHTTYKGTGVSYCGIRFDPKTHQREDFHVSAMTMAGWNRCGRCEPVEGYESSGYEG